MTLVAALVTFLVSAALSMFFSRYRGRFALLDHPNARSLHSGATPRSGGIAILSGISIGFLAGAACAGFPSEAVWIDRLLMAPPEYLHDWSWQVLGVIFEPGMLWALMGLGLVAAVSLLDDVWGLPAWLRLLAHLGAALMLVLYGGYALNSLDLLPHWEWHATSWFLMVFSLLLSVWLTNLYNFMDGMDGFAGGMAVIGFGTLALLGALAGHGAYASAAVLVALAVAGFLPFNFPPARLFMGDVGSGSLGFLVALFLLWAQRYGLFPLWLGLLAFSPFIVDATWTVIRRALHGRRPWAAHREHFYQRLVQSGWSHRRTTLWAYVLMLKCSLLSLLAFWSSSVGVQGLLLGWMTAVYLAIIAFVNARERRPLSKVEEA